MRCRDAADAAGAYLDGDLSGEARALVDGHLAACTQCASYFDAYRDTVKLAKSAREPGAAIEIPDDLVQTILATRRKP